MRLHALAAALLLSAGSPFQQTPAPPAALQSMARDAYWREFRETMPVPAIFDDERAVDCLGNGHAMTTA